MLTAGTKYSIGFEYRSTSSMVVTLGLGSFSPGAKDLGVVASQSTLPASSDWKTFWSIPFTATADQLARFSSLKFLPSATKGFDVRNVRIVVYDIGDR